MLRRTRECRRAQGCARATPDQSCGCSLIRKAPGCDPGRRRRESGWPPHYWIVSSMPEQPVLTRSMRVGVLHDPPITRWPSALREETRASFTHSPIPPTPSPEGTGKKNREEHRLFRVHDPIIPGASPGLTTRNFLFGYMLLWERLQRVSLNSTRV